MKNKIVLILSVLLFVFIAFNCSQPTDGGMVKPQQTDSNYGSVTISLSGLDKSLSLVEFDKKPNILDKVLSFFSLKDVIYSKTASIITTNIVTVDVSIDGYNITSPIIVTGINITGGTGSATINDIPIGKNRVFSVIAKDGSGNIIQGGLLRAVADINIGTNTVNINLNSTSLATVYYHLVQYDKANSKTLSKDVSLLDVNTFITSSVGALPRILFDAKGMADYLKTNNGVLPSDPASYKTNPGSITFDIENIQGGDTIEVIINDPASTKLTVTTNGSYTINNVVPGNWKIILVKNGIIGNVYDVVSTTGATTNPATPIVYAPRAVLSNIPPALTNNQDIDIIVGGINVTAYKYKLDIDSTWDVETPISTHIVRVSLPNGDHTIDVVAKDNTGSWQSDTNATRYSWTIDITSPSTPTISLDSTSDTGKFNNDGVTNKTSGLIVKGVTSPNVRVDLTADTTYLGFVTADVSGNWTYTIASITEGAHVIKAQAKSPAGNYSTVNTYNLTIDITPPTLVLNYPLTDAVVFTNTAINGMATDTLSGINYVEIIRNFDATSDKLNAPFTNNIWSMSKTFTYPNVYNYTVKAFDMAGNIFTSANMSNITVVTSVPTIIYVASDATNDLDGFDMTRPMKTLKRAVEKAQATPTIVEVRIRGDFNANRINDNYLVDGAGIVVGYLYPAGLKISGGWDASFSSNFTSSIIDGENVIKHLVYVNNPSATLSKLIISKLELKNANANDGIGGGGIYLNNVTDVTLDTLNIHNNKTTKEGGGIYISNCDKVRIESSGPAIQLNDNTADIGGGMYINNSTNISFSTSSNQISNNTANIDGGGLYIENSNTITFGMAMISNNSAQNNGGGLYVKNSYGIAMNMGGSIGQNKAKNPSSSKGGGIYLTNNTNALGIIIGAMVSSNVSYFDGGGIYIDGYNNYEIKSGVSLNNAYNNGGGIYIKGATSNANTNKPIYNSISIDSNKADSDNTGVGDGGGIYFDGLTGGNNIDSTVTISNNQAVNGGGIYIFNNTNQSYMYGQLISNIAKKSGGAAYIKDSGWYYFYNSAALTDNIKDNNANGGGTNEGVGGIYIDNSNYISIQNNQFTNNYSNNGINASIYVKSGLNNNILDNTIKGDGFLGKVGYVGAGASYGVYSENGVSYTSGKFNNNKFNTDLLNYYIKYNNQDINDIKYLWDNFSTTWNVIDGISLSNLKCYLNFDNNANSQIFGNTNGTISGSTFYSNIDRIKGQSFWFKKSNPTSITVSDTGAILNFEYNKSFAISFWVKIPNGLTDGTYSILEKRDWAGGVYPFSFYCTVSGGVYTFNFNRYDGSVTLSHSSTITADTWHHIVLSKGEGANPELSLYNDNASIQTWTSDLSHIAENTKSITIGNDAANNNSPFDGYVDELRIYNLALSSAEVSTIYNLYGDGSGTTTTTIAPPTYKIFYNGNSNTSGTEPIDNNQYTTGTQVSVLNNGSLVKSITSSGQTFNLLFVGWTEVSDGSGTVYSPSGANPKYTIGSSDVTLYAKWTPIGATGPSGGLVFYDQGSYTNGWQYLEAAPNDIGSYNFCGTLGNGVDVTSTLSGIGEGLNNTNLIVANRVSLGSVDSPAQLCDALIVNTYTDWFLPSKDELNQMYLNLKLKNLGGFLDVNYWSSTDTEDDDCAWAQNFTNGSQASNPNWHSNGGYVRAARRF